jgi:DnaJ-class molecular chaperone
MMEDHYSILGVSDTATQDEIKRAYRKLAMELHPDKNPGNSAAEERFKRINAAYAELGDPQNRAKYDQQRRFAGGSGENPRGGGFNFNFGFGGHDIDDILNQFFSQHGVRGQRAARNRDFNFALHITLEDAFKGKTVPVQFAANGENQNINVTIPAGVESGARIRYAGHGDRSLQGVAPGDLYIQINIHEHPIFKRNGSHLHAMIEIDALEAMLGCEREMSCIDGQKVSINIPAGTQHGATLRLRERGMPVRASGNPRGDCLVDIAIRIPKDLSEAHRDQLRQIYGERST